MNHKTEYNKQQTAQKKLIVIHYYTMAIPFLDHDVPKTFQTHDDNAEEASLLLTIATAAPSSSSSSLRQDVSCVSSVSFD